MERNKNDEDIKAVKTNTQDISFHSILKTLNGITTLLNDHFHVKFRNHVRNEETLSDAIMKYELLLTWDEKLISLVELISKGNFLSMFQLAIKEGRYDISVVGNKVSLSPYSQSHSPLYTFGMNPIAWFISLGLYAVQFQDQIPCQPISVSKKHGGRRNSKPAQPLRDMPLRTTKTIAQVTKAWIEPKGRRTSHDDDVIIDRPIATSNNDVRVSSEQL